MTHRCFPDESTTTVCHPIVTGQAYLPFQLSCLSLAFMLAGASTAVAQQVPDTQMPQAPKAPTVESMTSDAALPANTARRIEPPELAGRLELNLGNAEGQDSETQLQRDTGEAEVKLTLAIEQQLGPTAKTVGQLELSSRRFTADLLNNEDDEFSYDLERLYLQLDPSKSLRVRAGRFGIDDPMETIIDEDLDGVQLSFSSGSIEIEVSHTREDWFEASTVGRLDEISNTMGSVQLSPNKDSLWMPYILIRSAEAFNDIRPSETTWMGVQGLIEPTNSAFRYWVHGSVQDGEETRPDETIELGGYMVDLGINATIGGPLDPTLTVAIARATGGARDNRFRQSGLQSNDFALNGKNSFRYLGEVVDPELTNIQIITLGVGVDLSKDWSADFAAHHYQQMEAQNAFRGSDIEYNPLGVNDELGFGADLIVAYQPNKRLDIKGTAGAFAPGDAFDDDQDMAWLARLELDYNF